MQHFMFTDLERSVASRTHMFPLLHPLMSLIPFVGLKLGLHFGSKKDGISR